MYQMRHLIRNIKSPKALKNENAILKYNIKKKNEIYFRKKTQTQTI